MPQFRLTGIHSVFYNKIGVNGTNSKQREKILQAIQAFRYIDDFFFNVALDGYKPGIELILRTVMGDNRIVVDEVVTQKDAVNWYGKSVCFDVFASAGDEKFCFEIQ